MRVDIWSDLVCPWCYLGKRRFDRALERFPHRDQVQTVHRAFQLNPGIHKGETSKRQDVLRLRYALSPAEADALDARMTQTAAAEGLEYNLSGTLTGNTADAHRLLHLAQEHHLQADVLERLYRAYFTERRSLFDEDSLIELGAEAGLAPEAMRSAFNDQRYGDLVAADLAQARALGIGGVPFFVIDGRYGVSGAQSTEVFVDALTRRWASR